MSSPVLFQAQNPATTPPLDDDFKVMKDYLQNALKHFQNYQSKQSQVIETLNKSILQIEQDKANLQQQFEQYKRDKESYIQRLSDAYRNLQRKNEALEKEKAGFSQEYAKLRQVNSVLQQKYNDLSRINSELLQKNEVLLLTADNNIDDFNRWASNPANRLSANFYYIKGVIKARCEQLLEETVYETNWIGNRNGSKKYLFPNPLFFDELTDIREVYKIAGTLKSKGQNKIKIIKPCEIGDKGYINYPGEFQII